MKVSTKRVYQNPYSILLDDLYYCHDDGDLFDCRDDGPSDYLHGGGDYDDDGCDHLFRYDSLGDHESENHGIDESLQPICSKHEDSLDDRVSQYVFWRNSSQMVDVHKSDYYPSWR